ncbi:MAG: hypothetical protein Q8J89_16915 [Caulobacter sp.]|nr:hypothetical protein [Caulobacter sp.]
MRSLITILAVSVAAVMAAGAGVPGSSPTNPATRTICLDLGGESRPAICTGPASRLDGRDDICLCRDAQRVEAPVCGPGERPQAETRAFEKARKLAAEDGSLVGDLYADRPMCVAPRNR